MEIQLPSSFSWVDTSNFQFRNALEHVLEDDSNLFIQAKAGCGKSLLVSILASTQRNVSVVTTTGAAAVDFITDGIPAHTIHSFFGFPAVPLIPEKVLYTRSGYSEIIKQTDTLVIDEVSMLSSHLFDCLVQKLLKIRRGSLPRILLFGDVMQLPPVIQLNDPIIKSYYENEYGSVNKNMFFNAKAFKNLRFKVLSMDQSYRQADEEFANNIYSIGINSFDSEVLKYFNQRVQPIADYEAAIGANTPYIYMSPTNNIVDKVNREYIDALDSDRFTYFNLKLDPKYPDFPKNTLDEKIQIKVGAQVMITKNNPGRGYANGMIGIVTDFDEDNEIVNVRLQNGYEVEVEKSWTSYKKPYVDDSGQILYKTIGRASQLDCKICKAMTIHKAQGKTFENAYLAIGGWAPPGLIYVGLSRLKTLGGLGLSRPLQPTDIKVSKEAIEFLTGEN